LVRRNEAGQKDKRRDELLDELLGGAKTQEEIFGPNGVIKRLMGALVERALKEELAEHLDQEKQQGASNRRNGSSEKTLHTDNGSTTIAIPRDREATFEPRIIPKHATRVAGLDDKILALYARGMSTRDIQTELSELYGTEISAPLISRVTDGVQEEITDWHRRALEPVYVVVWLDALIVKMRFEGTVQNRAVHVAIGLTREGRKEILGLWAETNEGAKFWMRVLAELQARGVRDVLIACCDGLKGFPAAIEAIFPKAMVQTCLVHQVRHSLSFAAWKERKSMAAALRLIYTAESEAAAGVRLDEFEIAYGTKYPMVVRSWRANWAQLTGFLQFPVGVRKIIYTTNAIESLNFQLRKVIKSKGHFPSEDAALKLLYLALRNVEKKWDRTARNWRHAVAQITVYFGEERLRGA